MRMTAPLSNICNVVCTLQERKGKSSNFDPSGKELKI